MYKNQFLGEVRKKCIFLCIFSFEILPKFSDFVNSEMIASEKSHQNLSDYNKFLLEKHLQLIKNQIFLGEK